MTKRAASRAISLNDSAWLRIESARAPMHVGTLSRFTKPADAPPTYLRDLVDRWRETRTFAEPFNLRPVGAALPKWEVLPDDEIDIDYHFRHSALPAPGGERELGVLVSRLHTSLLDRAYPLWELHVIEGLEDDRWALYVKVHHSQVDGMAGIRMLRRIMSVDPGMRGMLPPWAVGLRGPDQSGEPAREAGAKRRHDRGPSVTATARTVLAAVTRSYADSVTGAKDPAVAVPFQMPKSILNSRIGGARRFATQDYSIERLRNLAKTADASINDIFLAISSAALRRYLLEVGDLPEQDLVATVPVGAKNASGGGNSVTFMFAHLGTNIEDPRRRLEHIRESARAAKQRLPQVDQAAMNAYTAALMLPQVGQTLLGIAGRVKPLSNLVISNVPVPAEARFLEGSLMESIYPVNLILDGQALNITAVSYGGRFSVGFTGCRDTVPHMQNVAVYTGEALAELEAAYGVTAPAE